MERQINLSQHFTVKEFTDSDLAARHEVNNDLPIDLYDAARATAQMMERIRGHLSYQRTTDVPIDVTSAYRCLALNRLLGSKDTSDHVRMRAIDFRAPGFGTPLAICKTLVPVMDVLGIGQVVYENTWVHVSSVKPVKDINRILTVQGKGYIPGIVGA